MGRINGNLNVSRSLGDLKYKQVEQIPPEEQVRESRKWKGRLKMLRFRKDWMSRWTEGDHVVSRHDHTSSFVRDKNDK